MTIESEIARLKATAPSANFYTVENAQGHAWIGYGSAYWGKPHYSEAQVASREEAEQRAAAARSHGYAVTVVFHDLAAGRARWIALLEARAAAA